MTAAELTALAARVEAATGADQFRVITEAALSIWGWQDERYKHVLRLCEVGAFLDAAMALVPEGAGNERLTLMLKHSYRGDATVCLLDTLTGSGWTGEAATPALALTAACLRARAAQVSA